MNLRLTWFSISERKMLVNILEHAKIGIIRYFQIFQIFLIYVQFITFTYNLFSYF